MTRIRPEQMGHKTLLRRGRSLKWLQYTLLIVAAIAAAVAGYAALTLDL
jgi:hypothetical protein